MFLSFHISKASPLPGHLFLITGIKVEEWNVSGITVWAFPQALETTLREYAVS
jgi:hypothetical protein